jgi:hypothetical protein
MNTAHGQQTQHSYTPVNGHFPFHEYRPPHQYQEWATNGFQVTYATNSHFHCHGTNRRYRSSHVHTLNIGTVAFPEGHHTDVIGLNSHQRTAFPATADQ